MRDRLRHHILLAALMATAACSSTGPSALSPYFAYTVAPMNGGSVFFTGESASWHATVASTGSGRFLLTFGRPDQQGPINFDGVAFAASAHGSAVRSLPKADTVIVGAFPAETLIADIGTCCGTWHADSGRIMIREVVDSFVLGDLDIWLSTQANPQPPPIRLTGTYVAAGSRQ